MKKTLKESATIWLSGDGIAGVITAVATGQIDPVVGGIAALMFGAQIFMRRAIGTEQADAVSNAMAALMGVIVKYKTPDGMVPMSRLIEMIQLADPNHNPFHPTDGP